MPRVSVTRLDLPRATGVGQGRASRSGFAGEVNVLQAGEGRQDGRDALETVEGEIDGPQAPQEGRQQARHVG